MLKLILPVLLAALSLFAAASLIACSAPSDDATSLTEAVNPLTIAMNVKAGQASRFVVGSSNTLVEDDWDQNNTPHAPEYFESLNAICMTSGSQGFWANPPVRHVAYCTDSLVSPFQANLKAALVNADASNGALQVTLTTKYDNTLKGDPKPLLSPPVTISYTTPH